MTYQFKIQIKGITKPPVWRRVLVPDIYTFLRFHQVIQRAFNWDDCHLFEFVDKVYDMDIRIANPDEKDWYYPVPTQDPAKFKLKAYFGQDISKKLLYQYDLGDSWYHTIVLEAIWDEKILKPRCLAGKGACPPENCVGVHEYERIKEVFREDPFGEEAMEYRELLEMYEDEIWDPNLFNLDATNEELALL